MLKKFSVLALAGMLCLPAAAFAGGGSGDLASKIDDLTRQLEQLKRQMADMQEVNEGIEEKAESWDLASRIHLSGDLRTRMDYHSAETVEHYSATNVGMGFVETFNAGAGFPAILSAFGLATTDPLNNLVTALNGAGKAGAITAMDNAAGVSTRDANVLGEIFFDSNVGTLLTGYIAQGATIGQVTGAFSSLENLAGFMKNLTPAGRASVFTALGYSTTPAADYENDTLWTTRARLNMRAKATENLEVKARLVAYKAWGMQDSPMPETNESGIHPTDNPYFLNSRSFDGTSGRQAKNNLLVLDRAFMNWNNIGNMPVWFSIGRRPTTDGPPAQLRMGADQRLATPTAFMDYPFDGISLGYAYTSLPNLPDFPGRIRFCYGRGFESGPLVEDTGLSDVDFAGLSWDIYKKGDRFVTLQSFGAFNLFNVPGDTQFPNPLELAAVKLAGSNAYRDPATGAYWNSQGSPEVLGDDSLIANNTYLDRMNMGNVYHTSGVYMDKYQDLNYFLALGWSRTDAKATDEMGTTLLGDFWAPQEDHDGYAVYLGVRYDIPDSTFKIGAEYNYGSKYWLGFTPGHDDQYASKLYTRGSAYEAYGIWDIPAGEAISKFGKAFVRLGYQHIDYDYTYSGMWLGTPMDIDEIKNDPIAAQFYSPLDSMDNIYLTLEAFF